MRLISVSVERGRPSLPIRVEPGKSPTACGGVVYFSSMSLELENKQTAEVVQMQVRYKLSPKIFEVVMLYTGIATEMGEEGLRFTPEREREILMEAWIVSHKIWHEIKEKLPTSAESRRQTVMNFKVEE